MVPSLCVKVPSSVKVGTTSSFTATPPRTPNCLPSATLRAGSTRATSPTAMCTRPRPPARCAKVRYIGPASAATITRPRRRAASYRGFHADDARPLATPCVAIRVVQGRRGVSPLEWLAEGTGGEHRSRDMPRFARGWRWRRPRLPLNLLPELKHRRGQGIGPVFWEEQPRTCDFDHPLRPGNGVFQPVRPLLGEEDVLQTPHDQRRNLQRFQRRVNGERVGIVEAKPIALEGLDALLR